MPRYVLGCALMLAACGRDGRLGEDGGVPGTDGSSVRDAAPGDGDAVPDGSPDGSPDASVPDTTPPALAAIVPAASSQIWLAEPIRFVFDEPIAGSPTVTARLAGTAVGATIAKDGDRTLVVSIDPAVRGVGTLDLTLGGTIEDAAGNAAALPIASDHAVPAWSRPALDRGPAAGSPAMVVADDGRVIAAWLVGAAGARRVVVSAYERGAWQPLGDMLGAADASSPSIALDASGQPVAGWIESGTAQVARWSSSTWSTLASPGAGARLALASPDGGGAPTVLVAGGTIAVATLDANDAWQPVGAPLAVTGTLSSEPVLAVPSAGKVVVAWIDSASSVAKLRASRFDGSWTAYSPITLGSAPAPDRASIAVRGDTVAIAWDQYSASYGIYAAKSTLSSTTWTRLGRVLDVDPAGNAYAPAIALDASGAPVVAWTELVETNHRGVLARWAGSAWTILGGQTFLTSSTAAPSRAVLGLRNGQAPVVGWSAGGAVGVARFNGPKAAAVGMARAPLAGCAFDPANPPARVLATGCFTLAAPGKPTAHAGLVPFDVVVELWTDGAKKRRWVALPPGTSMTATSTGAWGLPVGGFAVKEFAIETTPGDHTTRKVVETRFLVHAASGYTGFTYRWRQDGSDGDLLTDGQFTQDWQLSNGQTYTHVYPSRSHCLSCHEGSWGPMLGLRPQQLARWYDYNGTIADQLDTLSAISVGPSSNAAPWISPHDASATDEQRTRNYMGANCAHCHNPDHIAIKDLRPTTPLAQTRLCESIVPGSPPQSVVYARVTQRPGMPPLGTLVPDPLIENTLGNWITAMTTCP